MEEKTMQKEEVNATEQAEVNATQEAEESENKKKEEKESRKIGNFELLTVSGIFLLLCIYGGYRSFGHFYPDGLAEGIFDKVFQIAKAMCVTGWLIVLTLLIAFICDYLFRDIWSFFKAYTYMGSYPVF